MLITSVWDKACFLKISIDKHGTKKGNTMLDSTHISQDTLVDVDPATIDLSVIVPFRDEGVAPWFATRLQDLCLTFPKNRRIEFIVVDSGSPTRQADECRKICNAASVRYLRHETEGEIFSIGTVRDFGAERAKGRAITFYDIDWRAAPDFWQRLLQFIESFGMNRLKSRFFTIPALYLTEKGTREFELADQDTRHMQFMSRYLLGDTDTVQNLAHCSSIAVINRAHYLAIGGHRPEFRGHGYEDFELYHRLMAEDGTIPRAREYYKDTRSWDTATYKGFRSQLSILGQAAQSLGLFVVHLWHPRPSELSFYNKAAKKKTREIWKEMFVQFDTDGKHPSPLVDRNSAMSKTLVIGTPDSNITRMMNGIMPFMGDVICLEEDVFFNVDDEFQENILRKCLIENGIERILFNAPYANENRKTLYDWCRTTDFPYLVFERGALPDSWFVDENGFNADSSSYDRKHWDKPLSEGERTAIKAYINDIKTGGNNLEIQGERIGAKALAERLKTGGRKVLFVPLQRPGDSVIRHMIGDIGSFDAFLRIIDDLARILKPLGWDVICKQHPLETVEPRMSNVIFAPRETHFLDLVELASGVALINSGVGIYAMAFGKPCYVFGQAFYDIEGVTRFVGAKDATEISDEILHGYAVDMEVTNRFLHYLGNRFYSFAKAKTMEKMEADGSKRSLTISLDFYKIRLPNVPPILFEEPETKTIPIWAPVFARYKLDIHQARQKPVVESNQGQKTNNLHQHRNPAKKKIDKLFRNPRAFFKDSKYPMLRPVRYIFPK